VTWGVECVSRLRDDDTRETHQSEGPLSMARFLTSQKNLTRLEAARVIQGSLWEGT